MTFTSNRELKRQLGSRDRAIIEDAMRMRLTTNFIVRKRHMEKLTDNAVSKITARLASNRWLNSHQLGGRRVYFTPGPRTVLAYDLSPKAIRPLGSQAFPTCLAIASYFAELGGGFQVAYASEIQNAFHWMSEDLANNTHFIQSVADALELKLIRVDLGGSVKHIVSKCEADLEKRNGIQEFRDLMSARRFVLLLLTTTQQKASFLRGELAAKRWPNGLRFQIAVVPELLTAIGVE